MKKCIIFLSAIMAISLAGCAASESKAAPIADAADSTSAVTEKTPPAETSQPQEDSIDPNIPTFYSGEADNAETCTIDLEYKNSRTIDNPDDLKKITSWLKKAADDPQTKLVSNPINRSGSFFGIKIGGCHYNIDIFPKDYDLTGYTETDGNGNTAYQYNVTANGTCYQVPIELTYEIADIVKEITGEDAIDPKISTFYSGEADNADTCTIDLEYKNSRTIDNPDDLKKITSWLKKAAYDPETKIVSNPINRSGSFFGIKIGGCHYNIDIFPKDYDLTGYSETDGSGNTTYQYNVTANGTRYQVPIELTYEIADIVKEITGEDVVNDF